MNNLAAPRRKRATCLCLPASRHTLKSAMRYRSAAVRIAMPWVVILTLVNLTVRSAGGGIQRARRFPPT